MSRLENAATRKDLLKIGKQLLNIFIDSYNREPELIIIDCDDTNNKLYLKSDRSSCRGFAANQFRLFLHSAAYVLLHSMQQEMLKGTEYANATFKTIQNKIIKTAAWMKRIPLV
jgi:hypothetical protein